MNGPHFMFGEMLWHFGVEKGATVSMMSLTMTYWPNSLCQSVVSGGDPYADQQYPVIRHWALKTQMSLYPDVLSSFILCDFPASRP